MRKSNVVILMDCIDLDELEKCKKYLKEDSLSIRLDVKTDIANLDGYDNECYSFDIEAIRLDYIKRCNKPMMIEVLGNGIVKRVSDSNGGTWHRLFDHINEKGKNCCIWLKSSWNDSEYLHNNHYYVPLYYDQSSKNKHQPI